MMISIPHSLTLSRFLSSFLLIFFFYKKKIFISFLVMLWAIISDILDGWAARKLNQVTKFGRFFDPTADKILLVTAISILYMEGALPRLFYGMFLFRNLAQLIFCPVAWSLNLNFDVQSHSASKASAILLYFIATIVFFYFVYDERNITLSPFYSSKLYMTALTLSFLCEIYLLIAYPYRFWHITQLRKDYL